MEIRYDMIKCFVLRQSEVELSYEILQLLRSEGRIMEGTWQFIAGGIELGETPPQAALRELREETGLIPAEFYTLYDVDLFYEPSKDRLFHAILFCAIVTPGAKVILNEEHTDFRWVSIGEIRAQTMWRQDIVSIDEICRSILVDGLAKPFMRIDVA